MRLEEESRLEERNKRTTWGRKQLRRKVEEMRTKRKEKQRQVDDRRA